MFYAYSCIQYTCVFMHGRMTIIYSHMISLSCIIWIPANMPFISSQEDTYFGLCRDPGLCLSMSKNLAWATNILHETLQFRHVGAEESLASCCLFFSYWFSGWCFSHRCSSTWQHENPEFLTLQNCSSTHPPEARNTLEGTITCPINREKENHRLKSFLGCDMLHP